MLAVVWSTLPIYWLTSSPLPVDPVLVSLAVILKIKNHCVCMAALIIIQFILSTLYWYFFPCSKRPVLQISILFFFFSLWLNCCYRSFMCFLNLKHTSFNLVFFIILVWSGSWTVPHCSYHYVVSIILPTIRQTDHTEGLVCLMMTGFLVLSIFNMRQKL